MESTSNAQEAAHPEGFDYIEGSPHLKDPELRHRVEQSLRDIVHERLADLGTCRVLEVGAGHGVFTDTLLQSGASVTITEMSEPSARALRARFSGNDRVQVIDDPDGSWIDSTSERFDVVACISVLHHIPDYMAFLQSAANVTRAGGAFVAWQDPTWYPRRAARTREIERLFYYLWRVGQGDLRRGLSTRVRRARGIYDESNPADMSEYHVVRQGVDELLLGSAAESQYEEVAVIYYWSTQSTLGMRLGRRWNLPTNFALIAQGRLPTRLSDVEP